MTRSADRRPPPEWPIAADPDGRDAGQDRFRVLDESVLNEARQRGDQDDFPLWPDDDPPSYLREADPQPPAPAEPFPDLRLDAEPAPAAPAAPATGTPEWTTRAERPRLLDDPSYRERFRDQPGSAFDTSDSGWPILPAAQEIIEGTVVEEQPLPAEPAVEKPAEPVAEPRSAGRRRDDAHDETGPILPGLSRVGPRVVPPRAGIPHTRQTRRPLAGLAALLLLAIVSAFFGWVTAEPFWLAVGHSERGTATVSRCIGDGLTRRCEGTFTVDGRLSRVAVPILGDAPDPGNSVPARMTSNRGDRVYVGSGGGERAGVGIGLLMLCGLGTAWATGGMRLTGRRARTAAVALSFSGPLLLFALMLGATY